MGLGSFIKQGVGEMMIARADSAKHLIIYKHPDETVPWGSQLTVDSDEGCVFFRDGQTHGILPPGRHTLKSQNIPFLSNFMDSFTGGNLFKAEVFFVRTQPIRNAPAKFGGSLDGMTDPGTQLNCSPRVFGEFVVRVLDPIKFIIALVGQGVAANSNEEILRYVSDRMMMGVEQALVDTCTAEGTSILNISSKKLALQKAFMEQAPSLDEVGLQLTELIKFNISLNPDEKKELREAWNMVGKARREAMAEQFKIDQQVAKRQAYVSMAQQNPGYMQYAQAEAMIGAGKGMAKGGAGTGLASMGAQMAVGVGMAGAMQQPMQQPAQQPWMRPAPQYQHVQAPAGGMLTCSKCNAQSPGGKFCAQCGGPLAPPQPQGGFCNNCGARVSGKFCAGCGTPAGGPAAGPPQGQAPQGQGQAPQGQAPQGQAPQGYPPQGQAPQGQAPQGYPPQGQAPQGQAPQGYPPQGQAPQGGGYPQAPQGGQPGGGSYSGGGPGQSGGQQGQ